jgi:hypothetical protein
MDSICENQILKEGKTKLNALIIGGSGACGRELIDYILDSPNYESITVLSRRKISRWENLNETKLKKLIYIEIGNLDDILDFEKNSEGYKKLIPEINSNKYNTLFCCLGSRVSRPDFKKVDFDFVVASAKLAELLKIYHFLIISSQSANSNSWFNYLKTKGQADDEIIKRDIPCISILRPGVILDRDNDFRFGEKVMKYTPFFNKIYSKDLGLAIINIDLFISANNNKQKKIWEHKEIEEFANLNVGCC